MVFPRYFKITMLQIQITNKNFFKKVVHKKKKIDKGESHEETKISPNAADK